jgi:hypothetical protein
MPSAHPSFNDLLLLVSTLSPRQAREVAHGLDCPDCARALLALLAPPAGARPPQGAAVPDYGEVWRQVDERIGPLTAEVDAAREEARRFLSALLVHSPARQQELIAEHPRHHSPALVSVLLEASYDIAHERPRRAEHLARLALEAIERLDAARVKEAQRADLRGEASTLLGHALSFQLRFAESEQAFLAAGRELRDLDSIEAVGWLRLFGQLRRRQGRHGEAVALLERAAGLCERAGAALEEATILSETAEVYAATGDVGGAVALLARSDLVSAGADEPARHLRRRLLVALLQIGSGELWWAETLLADAAQTAQAEGVDLPPGFVLARAFLAAVRGEREEAERLLGEAWRQAREQSAWPEAAVAAFHLAVLHAAAGRRAALGALAGELRLLLAPGALPQPLRALFVRLATAASRGRRAMSYLLRLHRALRRLLPLAREEFLDLLILAEEPGFGLRSLSSPVRQALRRN